MTALEIQAIETKTATLKSVFDKFNNKDHWKKPFTATLDLTSGVEEANLLLEAIIHFHGVSAKTAHKGNGIFEISSTGYAC